VTQDDAALESELTIARPLARPARVGDVVSGKYRLVATLGRGGMGSIFLAKHLALETTVALKFMHPHLARDRVAVARFAREARAAATLKSEYAARIIDVSTRESGEPYIVMEHLEGSSLDAIAKCGLPIADAVKYCAQASDALEEAHSRGIIHRDVKPANLFLTTSKTGQSMIKVLDFGLAKSDADPDLVQSGVMHSLGTPQYMSPEQIRGGSVDARTDVWSLGATLYELLAGRPAFDGASGVIVFARILQGNTTPLKSIRPEVSEGLVAIIDRCLMRNPGERFASMSDLALALARADLSPTLPAVDAPKSSELAPVDDRPSFRDSGFTAITTNTPVAMCLPELPEKREPSARQTALAALSGPALVALAATFMALWMGIGGQAASAPTSSPAIVVSQVVKLAATLHAKDPRMSVSGRCAKGTRGPTCAAVARH
jgi:serine/threonine protein kinase